MIKEIILKWGLRSSEKEIVSFLDLLSQGNAQQNGAVVGMAALFHHQYTEKDPDFQVLVNSQKGENCGPISTYVMKLSWLVNDFNKEGRHNEAVAMKLWNTTFRCMSDASLHHHGVSLWKVASRSFPEAKMWLEANLEHAENAVHARDTPNLKNALNIYNFIPPQFCDS